MHSMASSAEAEVAPGKPRAAKACQRCNQKRIKCDALQRGLPCSRCREIGEAECTLLESRRGTYARKRARLDSSTEDAHPRPSAARASNSESNPPTDSIRSQAVIRDSGTIATPSQLQRHDHADQDGPSPGSRPPRTSAKSAKVSSKLTGPQTSAFASPEPGKAGISPSYHEISWTSMFEHFLEGRTRDRKGKVSP